MTKRDLILAVCNANPQIPYKAIESAINLFFDLVTFYLSHHQRVELRGFGIFSVRTRASHQAHNPQTGETISVPEKTVPFFKPSQNLRDILKQQIKKPHLVKKGFFSSFLGSR